MQLACFVINISPATALFIQHEAELHITFGKKNISCSLQLLGSVCGHNIGIMLQQADAYGAWTSPHTAALFG